MPLALITGSGRRIGRALAIEFAKKGWDIAVHYGHSREMAIDTAKTIEKFGRESIVVQADVKSKQELSIAFDQVRKKLGTPDLLINNAAIFPKATKLNDISEQLWHEVLDTNLTSGYLASQLYAEMIRKKKMRGRIVNFASLGAFNIWHNRLPYHVSKAGVIQLTKGLARDLAPDIAVNSISPGIIDIPGEPAADSSGVPAEKIPMKRHGEIRDVFDAAYFFATCSMYITGQNLMIDGGQNL